MKTVLLTFALFTFLSAAQAQPPSQPLKKVLELKMPENDGHNGASVTWHPVLKKYYAAMAGNVAYTLGIFDATGKLVSPEDLMTDFDIRSLWYNPVKKTIQMNGYADSGWAEYKLDPRGLPASVHHLFDGKHQPGNQSVGGFDPARQLLYFLDDEGNLAVYKLSDGTHTNTLQLALGRTKKDDEETDAGLAGNDDVIEDYNPAVVFTGLPGAEIGLRNITEGRIELYNLKDGHLVKILELPEEAPDEANMNFAYCNKTWWLFDKDEQTWIGYRQASPRPHP